MKAKHILFIAVAGLLSGSCIDDKDYNPQIPQEPEKNADYALTINPAKTFTHPGIIVTQADFDRAKKNIGSYPWNEAFDALKNARWRNDAGAPRVGELPMFDSKDKHYVFRGPLDKRDCWIYDLNMWWSDADELGYDVGASAKGNYEVVYKDGSTAWSNAVYWKMTGDTDAADRAVEILNAWAAKVIGIIGDTNASLMTPASAYAFANVAELMRDYTGWAPADKAAFDKWLEEVHVAKMIDFLDNHWGTAGPAYWANWDLITMHGLMAVGIYLDRPDLYNKVLDYVTYGNGNGNFRRFIWYIHPKTAGEDDIEPGQTQESGRDQGHNIVCVQIAGVLCRMAWNQDDDLYGYDDNRFIKGAEYVLKYNIGPHLEAYEGETLTYPFQSGFISPGTYHSGFGAAGRGKIESGFLMTYEHYRKHKNLDTRYLRIAAKTPRTGNTYDFEAGTDKVYIEAETIDHDNGAGFGHGTLLFTEE